MMSLIGLFFPAFITLAIRHKRNTKREINWFYILLEYGQTVLFCNLIIIIVITYIFKMDNIEVSAFNSFRFFSKYVVLAVIYSTFIPYLEEMVKKIFHIEFTILEKNEEE